jgi:hypothetical protein
MGPKTGLTLCPPKAKEFDIAINGFRHGVTAQMVEIALGVRLIQVPRRRQSPAC